MIWNFISDSILFKLISIIKNLFPIFLIIFFNFVINIKIFYVKIANLKRLIIIPNYLIKYTVGNFIMDDSKEKHYHVAFVLS